MATKIYKVNAQANIGIGTYPCVGFDIQGRPNQFSRAYITITSNEKNGGRFTKEKAISISKAVQRKVMSAKTSANVSANSGAGSLNYSGYLIGVDAHADSDGQGLRINATLISKDIELCGFAPQAVFKYTSEGQEKLVEEYNKNKAKYKVPSTDLNVFGVLTADIGGTLTKRIMAILDKAKVYASDYPEKASADLISKQITAYNNYVKAFLKKSISTSKMFGGYYDPKDPVENAKINSAIADVLMFNDSGTNFWSKLCKLMQLFGLVYCPNITGTMGSLYPQEFNSKGGSAVPGSAIEFISLSTTTLGNSSAMAASQVQMEIKNSDPGKPPIVVAYPETPDAGGSGVLTLAPAYFTFINSGSGKAPKAKSGKPVKRVVQNKNGKMISLEEKKVESKAESLGKALCRNYYYYVKNKPNTAEVMGYYSGVGGVKAGRPVSCSGIVGVAEEVRVSGSSTAGIKIRVKIAGVRL